MSRRVRARASVRWPVAVVGALCVPASADGVAPTEDRYAHAPPQTPDGAVGLALKPWLDDVDAAGAPATAWGEQEPLRLAAAPGEVEPAAFVVYARRGVRRLHVSVSGLRGDAGRIPGSAVSVREVLRAPTRQRFNRPATEIVGRFLPVHEAAPLPDRHFREIWIEVRVPRGAEPGVYEGRVTIAADAEEIARTIRLRVRPIALRAPADKRLGMYYRGFAKVPDVDAMRRELADMREHGITDLVTDLRPVYGRDAAGDIVIDTTRIAQGIDLIADAGFTGTVVVDSGLVPLARALGHDDVAYRDAKGASLRGEGGALFRDRAAAALRAIARNARRHPELDVAVRHLDEIFGRERLGLFLELAAVSRAVPELPIYATFSTMTPEHDGWRERVDPFLDIRGNHGYTFEWWIARGRDWGDYTEELRRAGDRGWFYHNERGTYFTARWARLINGLYLWAGPFEDHITWVYQKYEGSPLDDTDGKGHDFGVAFPDPADPNVLIPTRSWAAIREGWDDLRYLEALRQAIAEHGGAAPQVAAEARVFLDDLRADVLRAPGSIDPEALSARVGTPQEAPYLDALAGRYDEAALARVRERAEKLVVALQTAAAAEPR